MLSSPQPVVEPNVVWEPLAGSQAAVMSCPCNHILYEGTRGPGKTDAQLMYFRKYVGIGYGAFWRGVIFDREYKNLDDLINKSTRWYPKLGLGAKFHASKADYRWTWPSGEELLFRQIKRNADYWNYHGQEFPFIGWNELSKYPTSEMYDTMMSCNRTSYVPAANPLEDGSFLPEIPLVVFSTTNPYGAGHNWIKSRFIDCAKPGEVIRKVTEVYNPRTQQKELITRTQVRIFGSWRENKYLSPEYIAELIGLRDENKKKAWAQGDWNIVAGGAFDDLWRQDVHVIPRFRVPANWRIDRSFDWGSSHPFSVGWWAEANGEEVTLPNFRVFCPPKGTLIRIHEWYGSDQIGSNKGLKLSSTDVAKGILKIEKDLMENGWIKSQPEPGPADNQIYEVREADTESIAKRMEDEGVFWDRSEKGQGSRKNGLQLVRDRLEACLKNEGQPGLYFTDHCKASLATIPVLPRDENDPDDVDTEAEDHAYDDVRYRVLAGSNRMATVIKVQFAH